MGTQPVVKLPAVTERCGLGLGPGCSVIGVLVGDTVGRDLAEGLEYPGELLVLTRPGAAVGERGDVEEDECR